MNAATEFDVGPLTWVKSEIDLALERADQALQQYIASVAAGAGDPTQLKFCRTHLHQVQGALTIVGLDGVTQFAEAVEAMLEVPALQHGAGVQGRSRSGGREQAGVSETGQPFLGAQEAALQVQRL